ncbi:MAG: carboxynorspermidine decarboxylase [Prevotella sp.]|uniref:carboxynorspermidine decarboxylase n=1 Tax=unclassified Dysgonomonas TaxID=2630389 RepID=UPI0025C43318|nr:MULTISPECIES: carboxynorspermidine decarboxylase [unclassified Dysgonomonas]MDR1715535.1 carboxynorspermidine decarboxylase [Prevotella sp.]HMM02845.1 carboxynorspermidine decarboxylase [Dysgonomonas sp.]
MIEIHKVPSPCFVMEEELLRKNLLLIKSVKERAGVNIILAFKAFAMWKSFPIIREYVPYSTASSVFEAQLAYEEMGSLAHTFSPAYTPDNFPLFMRYSSHITFNSLSQYERFYPETLKHRKKVSCGIRINPEYSVVETDLYNPATPGSRLGVPASHFGDELPEGVEGLHFHTLCESSSYDLEKTLEQVEKKFGHFLPKIKWLNMGGGHLMTREDYNVEHLINLLLSFKAKYPNLEITMEPGSAFAWQTGILVSTVVDIVDNGGIKTAILDVSFACHMPDCLEMPYKPYIRGAYHEPVEGLPTYRMGGSSCLSGDFVGEWSFDEPLLVGDRIIFEDMIHYTIVKTTMFNGISHPAIALWNKYNQLEIYREFDYEDYKNRMS